MRRREALRPRSIVIEAALASVLMLLAACSRETPRPPVPPYSGKIENVLRFPGLVKVARMDVKREIRVGHDMAMAITDTLLAPETYQEPALRGCKFTPEYLIHYQDRDRVVQVTVSFSCRELEVRTNDVVGEKPVHKHFGRTDGGRRLHLLLTQIVTLG